MIIRQLYHQIRTYLLPAVLVSIFACVYFTYLHLHLGLMLFMVLVLFYAFFIWKSSQCIVSSQKRDIQCDKLNETIDDLLSNLLSVYVSTNIDKEQKRFRRLQLGHDQQYTTSSLCGVDFKIWYSVFYVSIFIVINGYAFYLTHQKQLHLGQLVSVVFVTLYLINNIGDFAGEIKEFTFGIGVLAEMQRYINELFAFGHDHRNPRISSNKTILNVSRGDVVFENVSYTYTNATKKVLHNVSFKVNGGQSIALTGKIGSGKSTATKLLLRFYTPDRGIIRIDNTPINTLPPELVRKYIGYIPQTPILFNRSIYDNIVYGSQKPLSKQEVWMFIQRSGVEPLFETVPNGLNTMAGKRGENLSGGQRQTIAMLRLVLSDGNKPIFIMDEPTSALDYESKHYVLKLLRKLMRNHTCLVVSHDKDVVQMMGDVAVFRAGELVDKKMFYKNYLFFEECPIGHHNLI